MTGGFDLGLERAGMECRWQVEIDPYCQRVLAKHWPKVDRYADIRGLDTDELEDVDLICGGFPCQDISSASHGAGGGIDGEHTGLWREALRVIRAVRPRYVLLENVGALSNGGLTIVLGALAKILFDSEGDCLSAHRFGAPHLRERVFIVGTRGDTNRDGKSILPVDAAVAGLPRNDAAWAVQPEQLGVADGISRGLDRRRMAALGNAVVPQIAEWLGHRILEHSA